jgi:hypothetical protein
MGESHKPITVVGKKAFDCVQKKEKQEVFVLISHFQLFRVEFIFPALFFLFLP